MFIKIKDLHVGYAGESVLRNVSMDIPRSVFMPFVGPNGSGKTTLLRAILGLLRPQSGCIETPFNEFPPGYVAQQKAIDPIYPLCARDIVMMGCYPRLRARDWKKCHARERVDRELDRFGLMEHADKTFSELSGGMRQKVMIARAFVSEPQALIMDEPTTELDEATQNMVLDILYHAVVDNGKTVLLAHHGLDAIAGKAEFVCMVREGRAAIVPLKDAHF